MNSTYAQKLHERALRYSKLMRKSGIKIIDTLQKIDEKKAFRALGYASLFQYTTEGLGHSEAVAYNLIAIARKLKEVPSLKDLIERGRVSLTNARRVLPVLQPDNQEHWLEKAEKLSRVKLEKEVAKVNPRVARPDRSSFITEQLVRLEMNLSEEVFEKLKLAKQLLENQKSAVVPYEVILLELLETYLQKKDPVRRAERNTKPVSETGSHEEKRSRQGTAAKRTAKNRVALPSALKNAVFRRDKNKCQVCSSQKWTEIHHRIPVSKGGSNQMNNLVTLCWQHHQQAHLKRGPVIISSL